MAPSELFFSTTDRLGVITAANTVFVRLSRFSYDQLLGAPHNIIRHPAMPGGAFKLMWDTLKAGEPFCAYVDNLAADGSTYSVFATITPLGADSYLSVRCRPQVPQLRDAAESLYAATRPMELDLRKDGASARDAATFGLSYLARLLGEAGFPSYEDFQHVALPAEVAVRLATGTRPQRPYVAGPEADLLNAANALSEALREWLDHQGKLDGVAQHLQQAIPRLRQSMDDALNTARQLSGGGGGQTFTPLMVWIDLWAKMMDSINGVLTELGLALDELRKSCLKTGFRVALASLHTETVSQFAVELIDGVDVPGYDDQARMSAVNLLGEALEEGFVITQDHVLQNARLAAETASKVAFAHDLMAVPRQVIASYQMMATGNSDQRVVQLLPVVVEQVRRADESLALLSELSQQTSSIAQQTPSAPVNAALEKVLRCMVTLLQPSQSTPRRSHGGMYVEGEVLANQASVNASSQPMANQMPLYGPPLQATGFGPQPPGGPPFTAPPPGGQQLAPYQTPPAAPIAPPPLSGYPAPPASPTTGASYRPYFDEPQPSQQLAPDRLAGATPYANQLPQFPAPAVQAFGAQPPTPFGAPQPGPYGTQPPAPASPPGSPLSARPSTPPPGVISGSPMPSSPMPASPVPAAASSAGVSSPSPYQSAPLGQAGASAAPAPFDARPAMPQSGPPVLATGAVMAPPGPPPAPASSRPSSNWGGVSDQSAQQRPSTASYPPLPGGTPIGPPPVRHDGGPVPGDGSNPYGPRPGDGPRPSGGSFGSQPSAPFSGAPSPAGYQSPFAPAPQFMPPSVQPPLTMPYSEPGRPPAQPPTGQYGAAPSSPLNPPAGQAPMYVPAPDQYRPPAPPGPIGSVPGQTPDRPPMPYQPPDASRFPQPAMSY